VNLNVEKIAGYIPISHELRVDILLSALLRVERRRWRWRATVAGYIGRGWTRAAAVERLRRALLADMRGAL
jgi:hypothetical protein